MGRGVPGAPEALEHAGARLEALRALALPIVQSALAAGLAWYLAHDAIGHPRAFFAPIAALIALGVGAANRPRRVIELTLGVAVGIGVGDVLIWASARERGNSARRAAGDGGGGAARRWVALRLAGGCLGRAGHDARRWAQRLPVHRRARRRRGRTRRARRRTGSTPFGRRSGREAPCSQSSRQRSTTPPPRSRRATSRRLERRWRAARAAEATVGALAPDAAGRARDRAPVTASLAGPEPSRRVRRCGGATGARRAEHAACSPAPRSGAVELEPDLPPELPAAVRLVAEAVRQVEAGTRGPRPVGGDRDGPAGG